MIEAIAKIILGGSLIGIGIILIRKIPILVRIPETEIEEFDWRDSLLKAKERVKGSKFFSPNLDLEKVASKIRVLNLKVSKTTEDQLQKLREKSKKGKNREKDNYWEELKKTKNQR